VRFALAIINDVLIAAAAVVVVFVVLFGGGVMFAGAFRLSIRSPDNPIVIFSLLWAIRFLIRDWAPWFGVPRWPTSALWNRCQDILSSASSWSRSVRASQGRRTILVIAVLSLGLKCWFALVSPGFFSGDDVEIHEMSLGSLLHQPWAVWDLRSPVFPLGFIYPPQWMAYHLGLRDTGHLVVAGRLWVALLSTLSVYLVWKVSSRLWPGDGGYAVLATALFATGKLAIAFGSSELPRPVSTVFVLLGFLRLLDGRASSVAMSGAALGLASAFRFSEAVFVAAAALQLSLQRRFLQVGLFFIVAITTLLVLIAVPDQYYWGEMFHSVRAAIDFTLVKQLSSRGYQPAWWYVVSIGQWTTLGVAGLALVGSVGNWRPFVWAIVPLLAMSALPHKEARYAIPMMPFVSLLAAAGIRWTSDQARNRRSWMGPAVMSALAIGLVHDSSHYRLPRSNGEVEFARRVSAVIRPPALAAEQLWRLGGHLYLTSEILIDLDPESLQDPNYLATKLVPDAWVALDGRRGHRSGPEGVLMQRGYRVVERDGSGYVLWRPARD
jgi:hypothetical protein